MPQRCTVSFPLPGRRRVWLAALAACLVFTVVPGASGAPAAERTAQSGQLVEKDDLYFISGESAPFTGVVRDTDEAGKPRAERRFVAGKTQAVTQWYKNGKMAAETVITQAKLTRKLWYENGNLEEETAIVSDRGEKVSEQSKMYYEDGKPRLEIGYMHEKLHGALREYGADGVLVRDETYDQGKLTRKSK